MMISKKQQNPFVGAQVIVEFLKVFRGSAVRNAITRRFMGSISIRRY
jgi:hypothetical protein